MAIDVGTPGYAIDITAAEFLFDGEKLSAAIESCKPTTKQEEEMVYFQGEEDPQERTKGQRSHECAMVWGTRQFMLFCEYFGGRDAVSNREFTLTLLGRPENDDKIYQFTMYGFRILGDDANFDKSASKNNIPCSFLKREWKVVRT